MTKREAAEMRTITVKIPVGDHRLLRDLAQYNSRTAGKFAQLCLLHGLREAEYIRMTDDDPPSLPEPRTGGDCDDGIPF